MNKKEVSVQEWIQIKNIFDEGVIQTKDNRFIKILKIKPINYELKSSLEKEAILNSYKIFFNTCEFNIQILVQSRKEDLFNHIKKVREINEDEIEKIQNISENYIEYIKGLNKKNKSSSKNFYIVFDFIYQNNESNENFPNENEKQIIITNLNDKFLKIKECLSRTNNICIELKRDEIINILYSFFNKRKELK